MESGPELPGRVRLYSSDLFVAERDDFRAEDFFAPVFRELDAIDFLAPDFEEAERDFADDFLLAPGDLAIANVLSACRSRDGIPRRARSKHCLMPSV